MRSLLLDPARLAEIERQVAAANQRFTTLYPGDPPERRPVHSVYGGAHLFKAGGQHRLGQIALASLDAYAPDPLTFAEALALPGDARLAQTIYERVRAKLHSEPVEDQRADFEDGYGYRADAEEDAHATAVGEQLALGLAEQTLPPFVGIRIKSFADESFVRAARTLDHVLAALAARSGGAVPPHFVVTLPKVSLPEHVAALATLLTTIEHASGIAAGAIAIDLMIETPQAIVNQRGESNLRRLVDAGDGRVMSIAFGTYDYTAACAITARYQAHDHPAADFARAAIQAALAGTGIAISDSVTTIMPIGPHRSSSSQPLSELQLAENRAVVQQAWKIHYDNITRSLQHGYYQSWDLHPAQLPVRYAAVYAFFLGQLGDAAQRLHAFLARASQATLVGNLFDDAATGQGLLNFFLRGIACGALTEAEALAAGITLDELHSRSFMQIVAARRGDRAAGDTA